MEKVFDRVRANKVGCQKQKPNFFHLVFIKEETKQATTKCNRNFSCLSEEREDLCEVFSCYDSVHFVHCACDDHCPYQHDINARVFCDCPIRTELYDKYKI